MSHTPSATGLIVVALAAAMVTGQAGDPAPRSRGSVEQTGDGQTPAAALRREKMDRIWRPTAGILVRMAARS